MKNIVAAVDFSDVTPQVLAVAREQAEAFGANLHLVHAVDPGPSYEIYGFSPSEMPVNPWLDKALENAKDRLEKVAKDVGLPEGRVRVHYIASMPTDGIMRVAKDVTADLIVVGSHGHNLLGSILLGSCAQGIVRRAEYPALIVPVGKK
ncbi:universal stress protein [Sulfuriroseicoccus oceanibius]|uniref:Universal stress protein n=1 Tax=Sulfuriroseicoccus oceanibius TaxID=2707525 RepID=A0A6B3LFI1_9BACT|nr:universal stress protein [Sulfuriroseicoccus oceanibius]QQL45666.1 universal stress protein [Sulfuriroseicoccus oceanibius]